MTIVKLLKLYEQKAMDRGTPDKDSASLPTERMDEASPAEIVVELDAASLPESLKHDQVEEESFLLNFLLNFLLGNGYSEFHT